MYDTAYLSELLKGVGFAEETANEMQGRSAAAGSTVYTSVLAADQGTIDMVRYSPDGQSWEMVDSWSEGVLGADGEWAFCADPTVSFQSGNLPAVGTGASGSGSRGIGRTKKPERSKGLFAVPSAR